MTVPETTSSARGVSYDVMVDWPKRLAREIPFLERLFAETGDVSRVLDVGAGTGQHSIALAGDGYEVVGVDPSVEMLEQARANAATAGADVRFVEGGFGDLARLGLAPADALICTGNALPHVDRAAGLDAALADFAAAMRPGGVLVLHLLNHERLLAKRPLFLGPVVRELPDGDKVVFLRFFDYDPAEAPERIWLEFVTSARSATEADAGDSDLGWTITAHRSPHTVMPLPVLLDALERVGFGGVQAFGDHSGKAFEADVDESVVVTARRERRGA
jgi:SAM-dependent methyltransferase